MRKYLLYLASIILMLFVSSVFASAIDLHEKPEVNSKIIVTIKVGEQLMPIFYTEKKDWVKVANPKNGDVGWAKVEELKGPIVITNVNGNIMRQQIITDKDNDKNPQVYSIVQYSGSKELKPEEVKAMAKKMQMQQQEMDASLQDIQKHMQEVVRDMFKDFDRNFYTFQVMHPVIVVPDKNEGAEKAKVEKNVQ
jgi:hypothetical protein